MTDVFVRRAKNQFKVHKEYLIKTPYFAKLLNGKVKEGGEDSARLPDERPEVFIIYTGQICERIATTFALLDNENLTTRVS